MAIIALMASLLSPSLKKVLYQSNKIICSHHLQQISTGFTLYYKNDVETRLPYQWKLLPGDKGYFFEDKNSTTGYHCNTGWDRRLNDYLNDRNVFVCPSDIYLPMRGPTENPHDDTSYGFNRIFSGKTYFSLSHPSKTILVGPTGTLQNEKSRGVHFISNENQYWGKQFLDSKRHNNNGQYLFSDGHFESLLEEELSLPINLFNPQ